MKVLATFLLALCACACGTAADPPLSVSDLAVTRPLPGTSVGAGYFTLENRGGSAVVITAVGSPQFENVEMHETVTRDDISRMQRIDALHVGAGQEVRFEPGGKHLMLMRAHESTDSVTLNFYSGETLVLSVTAVAKDP